MEEDRLLRKTTALGQCLIPLFAVTNLWRWKDRGKYLRIDNMG